MSSTVLFQPSPRYGDSQDVFYYYLFCHNSIKKAAAIINSLESDKFSKVLSRVIQRFHIKVFVKEVGNFTIVSVHKCIDIV